MELDNPFLKLDLASNQYRDENAESLDMQIPIIVYT